MKRPLAETSLVVRQAGDVVRARLEAGRLAERLGLPPQTSVGLKVAVTVIAEAAVRHECQCEVRVRFDADERRLVITLHELAEGPGEALTTAIGDLAPALFAAVGTEAAVVDGDISLTMPVATVHPARIEAPLAEDPASLVEQQREDLLLLLGEVNWREEEMSRLDSELDDTNRGVLALYQELDDRAEALRQAYDVQSRFLSNMTHEFRTPLSAITSLADLLLQGYDGELNEEQRHQVSLMQRSAGDLTELVDDLLGWAKAKLGVLRVQPTAFALGEVFAATRGMMRPLLASETVSLVFGDPPPEVPLMHTDKVKVAQILRNLVSNAIKFTEKGEIRVSAQLVDQRRVAIAVRDEGVGISEEDQGRIFEEFEQVAGPLQLKVKGTGLGLPLSRRLAEVLGGSLTVTSAVGQGSTFVATLPVDYTPEDNTNEKAGADETGRLPTREE